MSLLFQTTIFIGYLVSLSTQTNIGHARNNHHWDLEKEAQQQQYQDDIDLIDEHNDDDDDNNANDDDNQYLYLFNLNRQPSYSTNFRRKVFSGPKINLPIDMDEDVDKLQESASSSSSSPSPPTDENIEYLNPIWPNLIYYRNPLKKRDWLNENTQLTDNSLIVKKMPETIKWSTPIQPGNSKDLRKLRNLDTFNTEQYKHRDKAKSDGTHQKHSRSWTNESESAVNERSKRQG